MGFREVSFRKHLWWREKEKSEAERVWGYEVFGRALHRKKSSRREDFWEWGFVLEKRDFWQGKNCGGGALRSRAIFALEELSGKFTVYLLFVFSTTVLHFLFLLFGALFACLVMDNISYSWVLLISGLFICSLLLFHSLFFLVFIWT